MKINSYISKSVSCLLLVVMMHMHVCSAICAVGLGGCCGSKQSSGSQKKSCCRKKDSADKKEHDCQNEHFAFFNSVGKFHSYSPVELAKVFQPFIALPYIQHNVKSFGVQHFIVAFNCYHPPPPNYDVLLLNRSFRI